MGIVLLFLQHAEKRNLPFRLSTLVRLYTPGSPGLDGQCPFPILSVDHSRDGLHTTTIRIGLYLPLIPLFLLELSVPAHSNQTNNFRPILSVVGITVAKSRAALSASSSLTMGKNG